VDQEPGTPEETTDPAGTPADDATAASAGTAAGAGGHGAPARSGGPAASRPDAAPAGESDPGAPDADPAERPVTAAGAAGEADAASQRAGAAAKPAGAAAEPTAGGQDRPRAAVFRVPATALLAVALLAVCVSPFALGYPVLLLIFLVPVALAVWVVRTRTYADHRGLTVHTVFSRRAIPWSRVTSLRLTEKSGVRAVLDGKDEVTLPAVRVRHLPLLAAVSDGRITDPRQRSAG
jgi:hypothetical protein